MEIDRTKLGDAYIDGEELLARWKREKAQQHTMMPLVEAAHIGPIPMQAVSQVFRIGADDPTFVTISMRSEERAQRVRCSRADEV